MCRQSPARNVVQFLVCALISLSAPAVWAQTNYYAGNGTNYPIIGSLPGDQVFPSVAVSPTGSMVVWQDNVTDPTGWGISARRLDSTLSGTLSTFRVNNTTTGDQENARVALLQNGGAVFVWQGGQESYQHILGRFLTPSNTFLTTTDLAVSTFPTAASFQVNPAVAVLKDGNVVVAWASFNQAGSNSLLDVYAKILSPTGVTISNQFLVNQYTQFNQRTPAVAALAGGGFVVTWVSEQEVQSTPQLGTNWTVASSFVTAGAAQVPSANIFARLFQSNGVALGSEFQVDTGNGPSANPDVAAASDGSFMVAWSALDLANTTNGWDVFARPFSSAGVGGAIGQLNTYTVGTQYLPHLSAIDLDYLAVWTSLGEDGYRSGVFGQFVHNDGTLVGSEINLNVPGVGQQMQPTVASDGVGQFIAVWSSFTGLQYSFDLVAQRFIGVGEILQPMSAPYVWAPFVFTKAYQPELAVSWASLLGLSVADYEVYVDGASTPMGVVTSNSWTMTAANGLTASSTHTFAVDYVTTDGRRSPISPSTSGSTWSGANWYGVPLDWVEEYYGDSGANWPANVNAPLAPGGPSLLQVFLAGGNPLDPTTWLKQQLTHTTAGTFLSWNTQPGATYQVQTTTNFSTWNNLGSPRFAAGTNDDINIGGAPAAYYRVNLLRQ